MPRVLHETAGTTEERGPGRTDSPELAVAGWGARKTSVTRRSEIPLPKVWLKGYQREQPLDTLG
jgi:hypothetical protein